VAEEIAAEADARTVATVVAAVTAGVGDLSAGPAEVAADSIAAVVGAPATAILADTDMGGGRN
jgi:hypothetical protein